MGTINLLLRVKKKKKRDALVEVEEQGKESGMDVPDSSKAFPKAILTLCPAPNLDFWTLWTVKGILMRVFKILTIFQEV